MLQWRLTVDVTTLSARELAPQVHETINQCLPKPGEKFRIRLTSDLAERSVRFDAGLLHDIRRANLGPQRLVQITLRNHQQITTTRLNDPLPRNLVTRQCSAEDCIQAPYRSEADELADHSSDARACTLRAQIEMRCEDWRDAIKWYCRAIEKRDVGDRTIVSPADHRGIMSFWGSP
jgi:RNase adaptor protein for sRNA GlmZ degradation